MLCDKCNSDMVYFEEGLSCGWTCPKCGNGLVTTNTNSIQLDQQKYTISLVPCSNASVEDYKVVAKIGNLSLINAKNIIESGGVIIEDRAKKIKQGYDLLKTTSLTFEITPEFPYRD
ncbi:MAG: hypothetical protein J5715_03760 [Clostridiales bacterium]|nr:hypothetical protein [Clostridiales bacterium]